MTQAGSTTTFVELFSMSARLRKVLPCRTVVERNLKEMVSGSNRPVAGAADDSACEATDGCGVAFAVSLDGFASSPEHPDALSSAGTAAANTKRLRSRCFATPVRRTVTVIGSMLPVNVLNSARPSSDVGRANRASAHYADELGAVIAGVSA
jgi:hypothetical protein